MPWHVTSYLGPLLIAALMSGGLALLAWRRRAAPGAIAFMALTLAVAEWSLGYAFEMLSASLRPALLWAQIEYVGIALVPVTWLAFALQYTGRGQWLTRRTLGLLLIEPSLIVALVLTNDWHRLIWTSVRMEASSSASLLSVTHGWLFWVHTAYAYLLILAGTLLLLRGIMQSSRLYRAQAIGLLIGVSAPWLGNIAYLSDLSPFPDLDLTPFAFTVTGIAFSWALFRTHLLDIVPIARHTVVEHMKEAMIVIDAQGRALDLNRTALRLLGLTEAAALGQPAARLLAGWPGFPIAALGAGELQTEFMQSTAAAPRFFELSISPLYDHRGVLNGRVLILNDITERKQVEQALHHAKDAAESANRTKSAFLANMSHELRTPLTAILGYADLLRIQAEEQGHTDFVPDLSVIQSSGTHLLGLISDILDLSKIEAEKMPIAASYFEIQALIQECVMIVQPLADKHANRIHVDAPDTLGIMEADLTKTRQVLLNVLSNAAKFTRHGDIFVSAARQAGPHGEQVCFQVRDTGIGIESAQLARLFEPFAQADRQLAHPNGGTGLGLALSWRLCRLMGGSLDVASQPNQGSTFTMTLPTVPSDPTPPMASQPVAAVGARGPNAAG